MLEAFSMEVAADDRAITASTVQSAVIQEVSHWVKESVLMALV
jgi:hypothetical protein